MATETKQRQKRVLMDEKETAELLSTSPGQLQRLRSAQKGPPYHKPGAGVRSRILYDYDEVMEWFDRHKVLPTKSTTSMTNSGAGSAAEGDR